MKRKPVKQPVKSPARKLPSTGGEKLLQSFPVPRPLTVKHERGTAPAPRDLSHVPAPDPANFWPFTAGQTRTISAERPLLAFRVDKIHADRIEGTEIMNAEVVHGELLLNAPVVIAETPDREPLVTLTLREIRDGQAFLQVTAHPGLKVMPRQ